MEPIVSFFKFYFYYLDALFTGFPLVIRAATLLVMLMAIIIFVGLYRFLFSIYKIKRQKRRKEKIRNLYEANIREIVFSPQTLSDEEIRDRLGVVEKGAFKEWESRYITDLLLAVKNEKESSYLNEENYAEVIRLFSLVIFWDSQLHKRSLKKNKRALRRLINISQNIPEGIFTHLHHTNNHDLRKHAKYGHMQLSAHNPFKFLDEDFDQRFNSLDEIRIHAALKAREKRLPLLIRWVHNTQNDSYKCFLIEEIGLFNQTECAPQLMDMFKEAKSDQLKAAIAKTLGMLNCEGAVTVITSEYGLCSEPVQLSIIDALESIASRQALVFLENECYKTLNDELFIKIVRSIYRIDSKHETYPRLKQNSRNSFQQTVFEHVERVEISNAI